MNEQDKQNMNMELETGKTYLITSQRKGTFMMRVNKQYDDWTEGVVVGGKAEALMDYNEKFAGDPITIRTSFIKRAIIQP